MLLLDTCRCNIMLFRCYLTLNIVYYASTVSHPTKNHKHQSYLYSIGSVTFNIVEKSMSQREKRNCQTDTVINIDSRPVTAFQFVWFAFPLKGSQVVALKQGQISVKVPQEWTESKRSFVNYFILYKEWEGANSSR